MTISPEVKCRKNIEKWCLREAFNTPDDPYLPESVLWRQKEQFSDGVGYNWIDSLREYSENQVSDEDFQQAQSSDDILEQKKQYGIVEYMIHCFQKNCLLNDGYLVLIGKE